MAKNMEISLLFDFYGDILTEKQRNMIDYYYNDDLSLAEIAENEGITRQGVRDSIKRAESQLLEMEERLGLARRFYEMKNGFESIRVAARDIQEYNKRSGFSHDIDERASRILEVSRRLCEI
ncbi:MAG TPA: DNA-binding protein [Ruminococcaceae bacterium]|nr:DNA-binding protein [Oscillospiraceae bacterium]